MIPVVSTVYLGYEASFYGQVGRVSAKFFLRVYGTRRSRSPYTRKKEGKLVQDSATLLAWVANHNIEFGSSSPLTEIAMQ